MNYGKEDLRARGWVEVGPGEWVKGGGKAQGAVVERVVCDGAVGEAKGEEEDARRIVVRVTSYRRRLLDEDNLCPKYFIDGCRYAGLLPSDAPEQVTIQTAQIKVATKGEERTEIEIGLEKV